MRWYSYYSAFFHSSGSLRHSIFNSMENFHENGGECVWILKEMGFLIALTMNLRTAKLLPALGASQVSKVSHHIAIPSSQTISMDRKGVDQWKISSSISSSLIKVNLPKISLISGLNDSIIQFLHSITCPIVKF